MEDTEIVCAACNTPFVFTASEQAYYAERGFQLPKRCRACRQARRKGRRGTDRASAISGSIPIVKPHQPRKAYPVPCSECGSDLEVPFPPKHTVFCPDCFVAQRCG